MGLIRSWGVEMGVQQAGEGGSLYPNPAPGRGAAHEVLPAQNELKSGYLYRCCTVYWDRFTKTPPKKPHRALGELGAGTAQTPPPLQRNFPRN